MKNILFPAVALILLGFGCGQSVTESMINAELGGQGSVDLEGGTVDYRGENGERAQFGENVTIPNDFPSDVPRYENATIIAVTQTDEGDSLQFTTTDSAAVVMNWYKSELTNWQIIVDGNYTGSHYAQYQNDGVVISISASGSENLTSVVITRTQE